MNALSTLKRAAAGLVALGASVLSQPALAENGVPALDNGSIIKLPPEIVEKLVTPDKPKAPAARDFFTKTGQQLSCDYIRYDIRFGIAGDPGFFDSSDIQNFIEQITLDFTDQVPPGTHVVSANLSGDVTGPGGPLVQIVDVADTADTVEIKNFHISATDLDGVGGPDRREMRLVITAKIDRNAFPAPTVTVNQAGITARLGDLENILVSHDPALPDDGTITTGEKTRVVIDLTGCDDTPPGGTPPEPCFQLVDGEVLCDPQGQGDFIYRMPVGPDLAGQTVQLVSLTPGIDIEPDSQIAPAGGGVLEWTIIGASPGDTIELMVTGIQQVGGPVEGMGICCTQRITIHIPERLDCPPPRLPDIRVVKRALDQACTKAGPCDFAIRVSNAGSAPYHGPIVLDEVTGPGNAAVIAGPNAPWTCLPGVSPLVCSHPVTTLNPGQFVDLKLGFQPGPGWDWDVIRNCAEYDYAASGFAHPFGLQTNDKSCASIPICRRGDPRCPDRDKVVDLQIKKAPRSEFCTPDGRCFFRIGIRNVGTSTYNGPLSFRDQVTAPPADSMSFTPTPPWSCSPIDAATYQCDHPGVTLASGGSLFVAVRVNAPGYPNPVLENCVRLKSVAGEVNLGNNESCAIAKIRKRDQGNPDLGIFKECRPAPGAGAVSGSTICRIRVNNTGTGAPAGVVRVSDIANMLGGGAPVQITTVQPDGPQWACTPTPTTNLVCELPGGLLPPGSERHFDVLVAPTNGEPARNCARGSTGAAGGDAFAPFGEDCVQFGGSLRVRKTGDVSCRAGETCSFTISVTNGTPVEVSEAVHIVDGLYVNGAATGAQIVDISPTLGCAPDPTVLPIDCTTMVTLAPGESRVHTVTIRIPNRAGGGENANGLNCVGIYPSNGISAPGLPDRMASPPNGLPSNVACHPFRIAAAEKVCTPPLVMNDAGRCVCPPGTRFVNGTCVPIGPKPVECEIPGQIVVNNECVCPKGQQVINGRCRVPPIVCRIPGQIVVNGDCVCPKGQQVINGRCRIPEPVCRIPGQIVVNGDCVCPKGQQVINGRCRVPPVVCRIPGQIVVNGDCVCPKGQQVVNGRCQVPPVVCRIPGQIVVNGDCVCPKGQQVVNGRCQVPPVVCRIPGQIVVNGDCVCPKGQQVINGRCRVPPIVCRIPGQIVVNGDCVCPKGQQVINGRCQAPQPTCRIPGQIVVNGNCVCPKGQQVIDGRCRKPEIRKDPALPEEPLPRLNRRPVVE